jgi:hypothetical protein
MMNEISIKSCPFCGGSAEIESTTFGDSMREYYRVNCVNNHSLDWWSDTPHEAADMWNQRV